MLFTYIVTEAELAFGIVTTVDVVPFKSIEAPVLLVTVLLINCNVFPATDVVVNVTVVIEETSLWLI